MRTQILISDTETMTDVYPFIYISNPSLLTTVAQQENRLFTLVYFKLHFFYIYIKEQDFSILWPSAQQHILRSRASVFKPMTCQSHTDGTACMPTCRAKKKKKSDLLIAV